MNEIIKLNRYVRYMDEQELAALTNGQLAFPASAWERWQAAETNHFAELYKMLEGI